MCLPRMSFCKGERGCSVQELRLQDKIRIYALARELNVETKDLIDLCHQAGIDVKNQLSSLDPDQRDSVLQMVKRGSGGGTATAVAARPSSPVIPQVSKPVPVLHGTRTARREPDVTKSTVSTPQVPASSTPPATAAEPIDTPSIPLAHPAATP